VILYEGDYFLPCGFNLLEGGHSNRGFFIRPYVDFFHKSRNPRHKELVKVVAADGDEFNPFQQGMPNVTCFLKDARWLVPKLKSLF
jgi:hypothetical protein